MDAITVFSPPPAAFAARRNAERTAAAKEWSTLKQKLFLPALALAAALTLAACGQTAASSAAAGTAAENRPARSGLAAASSAASASPSTSPSSSASSLVSDAERIGRWEGQTYVNDWANFTFTIPDDWVVLSAEQIAQIVGAGSDLVASDLDTDKSQLSAKIGKTDTYAFYVMSPDGSSYIFLDLFDREAAGLPDITPEEFRQQTENSLSSLTTISSFTETTGDGSKFLDFTGSEMLIALSKPDTGELLAHQWYFVGEKDRYLLDFMEGASSDEAMAVSDEVLATFTTLH